MCKRVFNPAIRLLHCLSSNVKNSTILLTALLLISGFSFYSVVYGPSNILFLGLFLFFLLVWVYFYIANILSIEQSIVLGPFKSKRPFSYLEDLFDNMGSFVSYNRCWLLLCPVKKVALSY